MAMVVRANRIDDGIGGHISTYAAAATLYEIGFQHFFRAGDERSRNYLRREAVLKSAEVFYEA